MRRGGGKSKGSSYERFVCKLLSLWVTNGARTDVFWRSALSGGRATVSNRRGKINVRQAGDITAVAPEGHALTEVYYLECKHVKTLKLDQFLIRNTGPLADFWRRAKKEAREHGLIPVIIARQNGWQDLIISTPEADIMKNPLIIAPEVWISLLADVVGAKLSAVK